MEKQKFINEFNQLVDIIKKNGLTIKQTQFSEKSSYILSIHKLQFIDDDKIVIHVMYLYDPFVKQVFNPRSCINLLLPIEQYVVRKWYRILKQSKIEDDYINTLKEIIINKI